MHTCIAYSNLVWQQYRKIIAGVEPQKYPSGPVLLLEDAHWGLSICSGNLFSHELCWGGQSNCNLTCTYCSGTVQQVNTLLIKLPLLHFCYTMKYLYIKRHSSGDWKKLSSGSAWLCWSSCFPSLILPNSDLKATLWYGTPECVGGTSYRTGISQLPLPIATKINCENFLSVKFQPKILGRREWYFCVYLYQQGIYPQNVYNMFLSSTRWHRLLQRPQNLGLHIVCLG